MMKGCRPGPAPPRGQGVGLAIIPRRAFDVFGLMAAEVKEEYRGFVIAARQRNGLWQARLEGIGAES